MAQPSPVLLQRLHTSCMLGPNEPRSAAAIDAGGLALGMCSTFLPRSPTPPNSSPCKKVEPVGVVPLRSMTLRRQPAGGRGQQGNAGRRCAMMMHSCSVQARCMRARCRPLQQRQLQPAPVAAVHPPMAFAGCQSAGSTPHACGSAERHSGGLRPMLQVWDAGEGRAGVRAARWAVPHRSSLPDQLQSACPTPSPDRPEIRRGPDLQRRRREAQQQREPLGQPPGAAAARGTCRQRQRCLQRAAAAAAAAAPAAPAA